MSQPFLLSMQYYLRRRFNQSDLNSFPLWITCHCEVRRRGHKGRLQMRIREIRLMPAYNTQTQTHNLKVISPEQVKTLPGPHHMIKTLTKKKKERSFTSTCSQRQKGLLKVSLYWKLQLYKYIILDMQSCNEAVLYFDLVFNN